MRLVAISSICQEPKRVSLTDEFGAITNANDVGLVKDVEPDKDGADKSRHTVNEKLESISAIIPISHKPRALTTLFAKNKTHLNRFHLSFGFFFFRPDPDTWKITPSSSSTVPTCPIR